MTREYRFYRRIYPIFWFLVSLILRPKVIGREHIPEGACIACANHSSNADGFFMIYAFRRNVHLRMLVKKEVYDAPVAGSFLSAIGMIRVDRSIADIKPVRESMSHLKQGGKIGIFPEGRRVSADESADAKSGAIKLADKLNVPLIPVHIPRKKKLVGLNVIQIGEPYYINPERVKLTPDDAKRLSEELMEKINSLVKHDSNSC